MQNIDELAQKLITAYRNVEQHNSKESIAAFRDTFSEAYKAAGFKNTNILSPYSHEQIYEKEKSDTSAFILKQGSLTQSTQSYYYLETPKKESVKFIKEYASARTQRGFFADVKTWFMTKRLLRKYKHVSGEKALEKIIEEMR